MKPFRAIGPVPLGARYFLGFYPSLLLKPLTIFSYLIIVCAVRDGLEIIENGTLAPLGVLSDVGDWLENTADKSKKIVGISAFLLSGTNMDVDVIVAGQSVLAKAYSIRGNKLVKKKASDVNPNTSFMVASVSKTIVWTALSMVFDAGGFALDDPINGKLPFKVQNPKFKNIPITYKMLYAHTSGIKDIWSGYKYGSECPIDRPYPTPLAQVVLKGTKKWYKIRPGKKENYSNYGSALAALLVERHTGMEFSRFVKKYIFDPLGMTSSQFFRPSDGTASEQYRYTRNKKKPYKVADGGYCFPDWPSGQLWTTTADLGRFTTVVINGGRLKSGNKCVYGPETGKKVFEKTSGESGMGWFLYSGGAGHDGGETGVSSDLFLQLQDPRVAVGWVANGELTDNEFNVLTKGLLDAAKKMGTVPFPPTENCTRMWNSSACADDKGFMIKGKPCQWIGQSLFRINKFCKKNSQGKSIKEWCPVSCTNC